MTDLLDPPGPMREASDLGEPARLALAAASAAAGAIHLSMMPSHWGESAVEGVGFALAGWFQLAVAGLLLSRPSRTLVRVSVLVNAALIGAWAVSRTAGLPFGAHAGHAESASVVDLTTVGLEAGLVLGGALALVRPLLGSRDLAGRLAVGGLVPLGVVVLATAALTSPSARDHAAGSHGDHAAEGHDQAQADHTTGGHDHAEAEPVDDKGLSLLHNGQHGHIDPQPLDAATQRALDGQLAVTREIAERYPTVADAVAGGYNRVGPFLPGIGAHYMKGFAGGMNPDGVVDDADLRNPLMVIYTGTEPEAEVAGFMFYSSATAEPEGFVGENDFWHFHENLCLKFGDGVIDVPYGLDHEATPAQCERAGGRILQVSQWMAHVWSVPGYEIAEADGGVFAEVNPALTCPDGTYYTMPVDQWATHPLNACRSEL